MAANLKPQPDQRRLARWLSTTVTGILFVTVALSMIVGALVQINVQRLAEKRGWDTVLLTWWDPIMARLDAFFSSMLASNMFWLTFGFFGGTSAILWLARHFPDLDGSLVSILDGLKNAAISVGRWLHAFAAVGRGYSHGPYVTVGQAWRYILERSKGGQATVEFQAQQELVKALEDCRIRSWGRLCTNWPQVDDRLLTFSDDEVEIPNSAWKLMTIWSGSMLSDYPNNWSRHLTNPKETGTSRLQMLRVHSSELSGNRRSMASTVRGSRNAAA